ncbi:MAG: hypothetical protein GX256_06690 [Fretibacterium sp.]|nr:hypothetical protein [Fretibacterium sp.]
MEHEPTRAELMERLQAMTDEDIDLSDIPEVTDFTGWERAGDKFKKVAERNLDFLNRKLNVG